MSAVTDTVYTRANPYKAPLKARYLLNKKGSAKETIHAVFDLKSSGIHYHPGDSLGLFAENPSHIVDQVLKFLEGSASDLEKTREALTRQYALNRVSKKFTKALADRFAPKGERADFVALAADVQKLEEYVFTRDYVDVFNEFSAVRFEVNEFLALLSPANPRLYSIASSQAKHVDEVHLTVAVVSYTTHGREKLGLASGYLGRVMQVTDAASVYIQPTRHFHLPDGDRDIIMVGPGTGIAPFRAFLEQREMDGAKGRNWLFFGDQQRAYDFLYEDEFVEFQKRGVLTRIDAAFSRDQAEKVYVQHRMKENAKELWAWLQGGAYFYVCGDAKRMAKDVHQTLIDVAQSEGGLSPEAAAEYVNVTLAKTEKRYLKDVY
jgi:sulfite reductase (NADPH) flavoprotein alpha-component